MGQQQSVLLPGAPTPAPAEASVPVDTIQNRVRFSLGKKLLLGVVALLFFIILFLNISSILLFQKDKRAYTYQSQSTGGVLAGREVVNTLKHALDTLRLTLAGIDPAKS